MNKSVFLCLISLLLFTCQTKYIQNKQIFPDFQNLFHYYFPHSLNNSDLYRNNASYDIIKIEKAEK